MPEIPVHVNEKGAKAEKRTGNIYAFVEKGAKLRCGAGGARQLAVRTVEKICDLRQQKNGCHREIHLVRRQDKGRAKGEHTGYRRSEGDLVGRHAQFVTGERDQNRNIIRGDAIQNYVGCKIALFPERGKFNFPTSFFRQIGSPAKVAGEDKGWIAQPGFSKICSGPCPVGSSGKQCQNGKKFE